MREPCLRSVAKGMARAARATVQDARVSMLGAMSAAPRQTPAVQLLRRGHLADRGVAPLLQHALPVVGPRQITTRRGPWHNAWPGRPPSEDRLEPAEQHRDQLPDAGAPVPT